MALARVRSLAPAWRATAVLPDGSFRTLSNSVRSRWPLPRYSARARLLSTRPCPLPSPHARAQDFTGRYTVLFWYPLDFSLICVSVWR